jgi:hypothetical protein
MTQDQDKPGGARQRSTPPNVQVFIRDHYAVIAAPI